MEPAAASDSVAEPRGIVDVQQSLMRLRDDLGRAGASDPRVWSVDGTTFQFNMVTDDPTPLGGYVALGLDDGTRLLGQVTAQRPDERPGPTLTLGLGDLGTGLGSDATATVRVPVRCVVGSGPILGRLADGGLAEPPRQAFTNADLVPASNDEAALAVGAAGRDDGLAFATLLSQPDVPVSLLAKGFGRHTFVCGQSGSGKTYALGKLLEQLLLRTSLRILILDPNSDYVTLTEPRPRDETGLDRDAYDEQAAAIRALAAEIAMFGEGDGAGVVFGRLPAPVQALVVGLDPGSDPVAAAALHDAGERAGTEASLADVLEELDRDERGLQLAARVRGLGIDRWGIWASAGEEPIGTRLLSTDTRHLSKDWRAAVFDLGSVASNPERAVMSAGILGGLWDRRYEREPLLIVIDEAHNVCPAEPSTDAQAAAADLVRAIAAEGRKFGLYLLLSTQEPHKVHPDVLSQCANLFVMRTTSRNALDRLRTVFSDVPAGLLDLAPSFTLGQGVVAGRIAPHPLTFKTSQRLTRDGGRDVPADWASAEP